MDTDKELVGKRLKETFGSSSQESVAKTLCTSQGNISKWIAGKAYPSTENLLLISKHYNVSVDWLLGLSDRKDITSAPKNLSYESCADTLLNLIQRNALASPDEKNKKETYIIKDPLLSELVSKGISLRKTDDDFYHTWLDSRLSLFRDTKVLYAYAWSDERISYGVADANTESEWLYVYKHAAAIEADYDYAMSDDEHPEG